MLAAFCCRKRHSHSFLYIILLPCSWLCTHYFVLALELIGLLFLSHITLVALQKPTLENINQLPVNICYHVNESKWSQKDPSCPCYLTVSLPLVFGLFGP